MRTVVAAPDSFKGSLSSVEVAEAMARGIADVWPDARVLRRPLADGGEGTLRALTAAVGGEEVLVRVRGPLGDPIDAAWWRGPDGRAVVEMARASGLSLTARREPLRATTFGTGELIAATGADAVWLGAGGSATVDGGAGALKALGFRLLDADGAPIPAGGAGLLRLARIEPPAKGLPRVIVLADVRNPLLGPEGAAAVYGPQKGASSVDVETLEAGLARFAAVLTTTFGRNPADVPGAGAAGGLAGGLWAALGAEIAPGFEAIASISRLDEALAEADLVLTGEGRVDEQTAFGKTVAGVLDRIGRTPAWVLGGEITEAAEAWCADRGAAAVPILPGPMTLEAAFVQAAALIRRAVARTARLWALR
jgi:glycerate kinase